MKLYIDGTLNIEVTQFCNLIIVLKEVVGIIK